MILLMLIVISLALLIAMHYIQVSFNKRTLFSLGLALVIGFLCKPLYSEMPSLNINILNFIGSAYISLLKMLIVPLVFTAIINAIANLRHHQGSYLSKVVTQSVVILLLLTGVSAMIGAVVAAIFNMGAHFSLLQFGTQAATPSDGVASTFLGMIPANPIGAMANMNVIAVVIFAALLGFAALQLHKQEPTIAEPFIQFVHSTFFVVKKLANMIISLTPYGVFALILSMTLSFGASTLWGMMHFISAMYIAMAIVLVMHTVLLAICGYNPISYYKNVWRAILVAFTTRSSFGTLPVTMDVLEKRMKLSPSVSNFVPSIGATIGMNACAGVYPAMLVIMTLAMLGQPITFQMILLIAGINMIASLGVSGIPGTAFVAAGVTFSTLGLPFGIIALVQSVDPIIDMGRTATNINGVMTTASIVDKLNPLDIEKPIS